MNLLIIGVCVALLFLADYNLIGKVVWGYMRGGCHGPSPSVIKTVIIPWGLCFILHLPVLYFILYK